MPARSLVLVIARFLTGHLPIQSPLVIVYLVIADMFSLQIVYFRMHFSGNSGFSRNSGHFEADGRIHYYERRLYMPLELNGRAVVLFT